MKLTKKRVEIMIFVGILTASLAFFGAVISQKRYQSTTDILLVQNQPGNTDYYAMFKSSEYLSKVLVDAVYSEKFLDEMSKNGIIATSSFLPEEKAERLKAWRKTVGTSRSADTGIVSIEVFNDDPQRAGKIAESMISVLTTNNKMFLGEGKDVEVRVLSGPLVEKNLDMANLAGIIGGGLIAGMLLMVLIFFFKDETQGQHDGAPKVEQYSFGGSELRSFARQSRYAQPIEEPVMSPTMVKPVATDSKPATTGKLSDSNFAGEDFQWPSSVESKLYQA